MDTAVFLVTAQWVLRAVLAAVFVGMGILHFVPASARTMAAIIPPRLRGSGLFSPASLVAVSGVAEILGGLGLLAPWPWVRIAAGIGLLLLLAAVFPANVYAAQHPDRFGKVAVPFWPRLAGQVVLAALIVLAIL